MRPRRKTATTIWTTALVSPFLVFLLAYSRMECGELDPCRTGGLMPYAPAAILLLLGIAAGHAAFLAMIWRGASETRD